MIEHQNKYGDKQANHYYGFGRWLGSRIDWRRSATHFSKPRVARVCDVVALPADQPDAAEARS
jgi:hypothetical protein